MSHEIPSNPLELALSDEELLDLRHKAGTALITHGCITEIESLLPSDGGFTPRMFTYPLPQYLVRELFFPDDYTRITDEKSEIMFMTPYRLYSGKDIFEEEGLYLSISSRLASDQGGLEQRERYAISESSVHGLDGSANVEYLKDGRLVSPTDFQRNGRSLDADLMGEVVENMTIFERPLSLDDKERIERIIDFIEASPRLTD